MKDIIIDIILSYYPKAQAIYVFGSSASGDERPDSDIDIAILLSPDACGAEIDKSLRECSYSLSKSLRREVDLINLRDASTVFQKEVVSSGKILYCSNQSALEEFEMLTFSYYQKLSEERKALLDSFFKTKRAYRV